MELSTEQIETEFAGLLLRAGLRVPPDRRPILLRCYVEVRQWSETIRRWQTEPSSEPANVYDIRTITRESELQ